MNKVSIVIIAKNEEKRIRECLESAKWADEIVVIDDCSNDKTVDIAKEYTKSIHQRKMDVEGRHRNFGYSKAKNEWVLSLDCDERITPELATEIMKILDTTPPEYVPYAIPFKTFLGKRWGRYAGYYPARKVRLFKKDKVRYEEAGVHPRIFIEGKCGQLNGDILHYSYETFYDVINKLNRETLLEAQKWVKDGRKASFIRIVRKCISRFLKFYFQKKGYRDGFLGFMFTMFHVLYQLFSYARYWELTHPVERT
jgi:glycosyltransferase involved in cell wall biosynthesis